MRSFNVTLLLNNAAADWTSWDEKIAAIKAFYAPVCELNITLTPSKLTPQFTQYAPISGSTDTYVVEPTWYEENVLPLAQGADIVIFVVPPTDHPNIITYLGLDVYQQGQVGRLTVFADETSHTYVGQIDQGETAVIYAEHELSHQFYGLLAKTDNTHLYFYGGTPEKVLADFDFEEQQLEWYTLLVQKLELELGLLKARQVTATGDTTPSKSQNLVPPAVAAPKTTQPSPSVPTLQDLFNFIEGYEGWATPGEVLNGVHYPNGSISCQCNNPENAKWAGQANAQPKTFIIAGREEIFAAFDTLEHGTEYALTALTTVINGTSSVYNEAAAKIGLPNSGELTIDQFFLIRDGVSDGNNPTNYADAAGKALGVDSATFRMKQFSLT